MNEKLFRNILHILDPSIDVRKNQKITLDLAKLGALKDTFIAKFKSLLSAPIPKESNITVEGGDASTLTLSMLPAQAENEAAKRTISITPAQYENIVSLQEKEHKVLTDTGINIHRLEGEVKLSSTAKVMQMTDKIPDIRMYITGVDGKTTSGKTTSEKNAVRKMMLNPKSLDTMLSEAENIKSLPLADRAMVIGLFLIPGNKELRDYAVKNGFEEHYNGVVEKIQRVASEMKAAKDAKKQQSAAPANHVTPATTHKPNTTSSLKPLQESDNILATSAPTPKR